jgi:hypothetical protein
VTHIYQLMGTDQQECRQKPTNQFTKLLLAQSSRHIGSERALSSCG